MYANLFQLSGPAGVVGNICRPGEDSEVHLQISGAEGHPGPVEGHGRHDQPPADPLQQLLQSRPQGGLPHGRQGNAAAVAQ